MSYKGERRTNEKTKYFDFKSKDDPRQTNVKIDVQPALRLGWTF